jgi:hypothetical protein
MRSRTHSTPEKTGLRDSQQPPDILRAIRADKEAWKNFRSLPESYKRIRIAYIESRRRRGREAFLKSLNHFIKMTARNKRFGFVREMR